MFKKFTFLLTAALASSSVFATAPQHELTGSLEGLTRQIGPPTVYVENSSLSVQTTPAEEKLDNSMLKPAKSDVYAFSLSDAETVPAEANILNAATANATFDPQTVVSRSPHRAPGTVRQGSLFTNDLNYQGKTYSSRITIEKSDVDNAYTITNIYGTGATINATIDETAGTVTIPCQTVVTVSQGDVKICPMTFTNGQPTYSLGNIVGTIDTTGKITLPGWGLLITEGESAGSGYNFFVSSEWTPANATVTAFDIGNSQYINYECLIKQTSDNSLAFYGLSGVTSEVLNSRLTSSKNILIPNTFVYSNMYYGDFYIYPYDITTEKAQAGTNLKGTFSEGSITFPAWAIASRQYPTLYVGYKYSEIRVTPQIDIAWPDATEFNADGEGTAESPFLIRTVDQFMALATTVANGFDFNGDNFALAADLDFSAVPAASFQPVGDTDTPFNGIFDGAGHTIRNLTVDNYSFVNLGLFGHLGPDAIVKNLNVSGLRLSSTGTYVGAIAGFCEGSIDNVSVTATSIIGNCEMAAGIIAGARGCAVRNTSFQGSVSGIGSVAGIASQSANATFDNCHVRANILHGGFYSSTCRDAAGIVGAAQQTTITNCSASGVLQDTKGYAASGGIAGRLLSQSAVNGSFSTMAIQATANSTMGSQSPTNCYQGGLFGYASDAKEIRDCYCSSYIFQNTAIGATYTGGLIGYLAVSYSFSSADGNKMNNLSHLYNCYFSGQVYSAATVSHKNIYGSTYHLDSWTGEWPENLAFHNCYYDNQIALVTGDEWGRPTDFFTNGLPDGFDATVWTAQSGYYPVITALKSTQASELSSAPLFLADGQNATKVSRNFTITPTTNVSWGISETNGVVQESGSIAISGSNVTIKDQYDNTVIVAQSSDGWGMKLYRLSIVPNWFDGEGTADDPFQLKTADDFIKLNTAVGTYAQAHVGDTFKVMNDIDFSGSSFQGVSADMGSNRPFGGTLDGDGHTLHNLVIDGISTDADGKADQTSSRTFAGLFAMLSQTSVVKNLTMASDCSFKAYSYTGSIAGASYGRIENCRNYAPVYAANSYAGGIAGYAARGNDVSGYDYTGAVIARCYNAASITGSYSSYGGIVGFGNALVQLCQNDGDIVAKSLTADSEKTQTNSLGGIVGYLASGTVDRCVNNATVSGYYAIGGLVGLNASASVTASVNNGFVLSNSDDVRRGGIIGSLSSKETIENNYYDSAINVNGAANNGGVSGTTGLCSADMTSGSVLENLSDEDYNFVQGQYPVLSAYASEPATVALRSMVALFGQGQIRSNALEPVRLSDGTQWTLTEGTNFKIADNTLSVEFPADLSVPYDTLTAVKGDYRKVLPISAIPVILKGDGSEASPFLIETTDDWNKLSDFMTVNKYEYNGQHFRMVNDLDFQGDSIKLLAVNGVKFEGIFDGNGKTVTNYVYSNANSTAVATSWKGPNLYRGVGIGLFGTVGADGTVKNLTANGKFEAVNNIGGIAGDVYGTLLNVTHNGTISNTSGANCAGIASKVLDGGKLINCVNNGNVTSKTTTACGITQSVAEGATVDGCINKGNVKSTTTGAYGIANSVAGTLSNCYNTGSLSGTGSAAGICGTLTKTGKLENCHNDVDIKYGTAGGTIAGVLLNTSDQTTAGTVEPTSWIKNCYNTGEITGKATVYGFCATIKKGVLVEDCYNTGNVSAVTTNAAYGFTGAITSNNAENLVHTQIRRCWNGGDVTSETAASAVSAGFGKTLAAGAIVEDCYNLGNVTVKAQATTNSQICCAVGFISQISGGHVSRCWNAGTVYGLTPCNAGLAGYVAGTNVTTIEECFNVGNITGNSMLANGNSGNTNGTSGGLFGYISTGNPVIRNCYNAGDVTGNNRVGGIAGGMFRPDAVVENCYNSGKVNCGNNWWSGTIYTSNEGYTSGGVTTPYFSNSKNLYYDAGITTGTEYRNFPGSAKSTAEMAELDLGEAFYKWNVYPVLKSFNTDDASETTLDGSHVSTAMIVVADGDSYLNVNAPMTLAADPSVKWSVDGEGELEVIGSTGYPRKTGKVTVTASNADGTIRRSFQLELKTITTGIDDIDTDGKNVISTLYVDAAGRIIPVPTEGQPYVVKITYDDGTSTVRKVVPCN